jgi:hypothetical protein
MSVVNQALANNPFATGVKSANKNAGGPLPITKYKLQMDIRPNYIR